MEKDANDREQSVQQRCRARDRNAVVSAAKAIKGSANFGRFIYGMRFATMCSSRMGPGPVRTLSEIVQPWGSPRAYSARS